MTPPSAPPPTVLPPLRPADPPSNALITYSLAAGGTSVAALFMAGYVPGSSGPCAVWRWP